MNLRNLAPALQEKILFLPSKAAGTVNETVLRKIADETDWSRQAEMFETLWDGPVSP